MSQFHISVDCVWSEFKYTNCSNQCGPGVRNGTRSILTPAQHGGKNCTGPSVVTTQCNSDPGGGKNPPLLFQNMVRDHSHMTSAKSLDFSCPQINEPSLTELPYFVCHLVPPPLPSVDVICESSLKDDVIIGIFLFLTTSAPSMFEVLKEDTSSLQPCQNREEEIKSCVRVNVDFDTIDASDRLKAFCTSVERKFEAENSNDTRFYEVSAIRLQRYSGIPYNNIHPPFVVLESVIVN